MVLLQHADGSWTLEKQFCDILGKSEEDLTSSSPDASIPTAVWATALALVWLQVKYPNKKDVWELLYDKGKLYLQQSGVDVTQWLSKATSVIK